MNENEKNEIVEEIKKHIKEKIRPALVMDGGNIEYVDFDNDTGILKVKLLGACHGCPMASLTLKHTVESILKEYIPEIEKVESVDLTDEDMEV